MIKLEPRAEASRFWSVGSPLLALLVTVVLGVVLFTALGKDPVKGLQVFFWEPIRSGYALGELMVKATPLLLIALGLAALLLFVVVEWKASHPSAVPASASASQIFIHGTPVCVFRLGDSIVARIGDCGSVAAQPDGETGGGVPDEVSPDLSLPPGHPPVAPGMRPESGERRILI